MFHGPMLVHGRWVAGGGPGGGAACSVLSTLHLPGEATTLWLLALNQQRPLLSVEKRQPRAHHVLLLQRAQQRSMELPGAEPSPGVCGLMSTSLSGGPH